MRYRQCLAAVAVVAMIQCTALAETSWEVVDGHTTLEVNPYLASHMGLSVAPLTPTNNDELVSSMINLDIAPGSTMALTESDGAVNKSIAGEITHGTGLVLSRKGVQVVLDGFKISLDDARRRTALRVTGLLNGNESTLLEILAPKMGVDRGTMKFLVDGGALIITQELADALGHRELTGRALGSIKIRSNVAWSGGDDPTLPTNSSSGAGAPRGTNCGGTSGPDVIVGDLPNLTNYTSEDIGGGVFIDCCSVGTTSCNIGTANLSWIDGASALHPVIGQNFFRLANGRIEQLGQTWLKHGFFALQQNECCTCSGSGSGSALGVGCSDPYSSSRNGTQGDHGPKWQVDGFSAAHTHPIADPSYSGTVARRLQIRVDELNEPGALYFIEGQYMAADDAAAGNANNNASYREVLVTGTGNNRTFTTTGATQREEAGIRAWQDNEPTVVETDMQIPNEGLIIMAAKATDLGGGLFRYDYAVQNLTSERSVSSFSIPVDPAAVVSNLFFRDVDYHSGDGEGDVDRDGTDWPAVVSGGTVTWTMVDVAGNNDNAIRWGTMYNFGFECNRPPEPATATLDLYQSGSPANIQGSTTGPAAGPQDCNNNGVDDDQDIANGTSPDCNTNGVPDECEGECQLMTLEIASGFSSPVGVYAPPNDTGRLFVVEQTGAIEIINLADNSIIGTYLNISGIITSGGERGLLGLAFDPDFDSNGFFYVNYTNNFGNTVIARYTATGGNPASNTADAGSAVILKTIGQDFANHNGGCLQFGPDDMLYCGMGDGGSGGDPNNRSQTDSSLLGKMLRLDVDNPPSYIPADNPGAPNQPETWAKGLRNPWRFSFDRFNGDMYIGDVGQDAVEEISYQPASSTGGENYGWRCYEGNSPFNTSGCAPAGTMVFPIRERFHGDGQGTGSIVGGHVYRGCDIPGLSGTYFLADTLGDWIESFRYDGATVTDITDRTTELGPIGSVVAFGEDANGEMYIVSILGSIYKIVCFAPPECGNGILEAGEECDDGNSDPGDGCFDCMFEQANFCTIAMSDDFENGNTQGWNLYAPDSTASTGDGVIGDPNGTFNGGDPAQPEDAFAGTGCMFTAQNSSIGTADVDGGVVYFESPTIDLSGETEAVLVYVRWWYQRDFGDDPAGDFFVTQASDDNGASWVTLESFNDSQSENFWSQETFDLHTAISLTNQVKIRFGASDGPATGDIIEMAIDEFVVGIPCPPIVDCNNNGVDDADDISMGTSQDCNSNTIPDECDIEAGTEDDCDGGPIGLIANGQTILTTFCQSCHNTDGSGGTDPVCGGACPGPNIRGKSRVEISDKLTAPTDHPGGSFNFTPQEYADLEAFLSDTGSRGRPDGIPDSCQSLADCDTDTESDGCELENGTQTDLDYDGIPDECASCSGPADGDMNLDTVTDSRDIQAFVDALLGTPTPDDVCHGDYDASTDLGMGDVAGFVADLVAP